MSRSAKLINNKRELSSAVTGLLMALGLLTALLPIPRALAVSNQPWLCELAVSLLLLAGLSRNTFSGTANAAEPRIARTIQALIGIFILWSLASTLWANSAWATLHHSFEWVIYLGVVQFAIGTAKRENGYRSILYGLGFTSVILLLICAVDFLSVSDFASVEGTLRIRYGKFGEMAAVISPVLAGASLYARSGKGTLIATAGWLGAWLVTMLSLSKGAFIAGIAGHVILFAGVLFFARGVARGTALTIVLGWLAFTIGAQAYFSQATSIPATTNYITGSADKTRSTSEMRVFTWQVGWLLLKEYPLKGVGADNFGARFNEGRTMRPHANTDTAPEIAEDYVVERAHNEPLQITAELGGVGLILFAAIFAPFLLGLFRRRQAISPMLWAAIGGMVAFAASSMVSSFSFRVVQNGVVFFLVFSIALNEVGKVALKSPRSPRGRGWALGIIAMVLLASAYFGTKAVAESLAYRAERVGDTDAAQQLYERSLLIDPDNANARYFYSSLLAGLNEPADAAVSIRQAIDRGLGVSVTYGLLAKYEEAAGNAPEAEATYAEALRIFPNSVYLRVAFACFLERAGRVEEFQKQMSVAKNIDPKQANGWYMLISRGSVASYMTSQKNADYAPPAELLPSNAVNSYLDDPRSPRQTPPPDASP